MEMNVNTLTNRQMREISKVLGGTPDEWEKDPFGMQAAFVWQAKVAQGETDFTFEQALDLSIEETKTALGITDAPKAGK